MTKAKSYKRAASSRSTPAGSFFPMLVVIAVYLVAALVTSFLCDDAFITFRYAKNLAEGFGPVYNVGERVEGYTNFLWMLLMAAVLTVKGSPELWSRVFSIASGAGILLLLMLWERQKNTDWRNYALFPAFLAVTAPFVVWSTGGLETMSFAFLLLASVMATLRAHQTGSIRQATLGGVLAGLAILTRPDGLIVAGLSGLFLCTSVVQKKIRPAVVAAFATPLVLIVGSHLVWRLFYYGQPLPNTFYVKTPAFEFLSYGAAYVGRFGWESALWFALFVAAFLNFQRKRWPMNRNLLFLLVVTVVFSAWVVYTGGDFMVMGRFLVPILGIIYLLLQEMTVTSRELSGVALTLPGIVLVLHIAYSAFLLQRSQTTEPSGELDSVGLLSKYRDNWTRAGKLLKHVARPTDTILTSAAGIVPYYSGLYTVDLLGLTSPDLSQYRQRPGALRRPGHTLSLKPEALIAAPPQFLVGHPIVAPVDSAYFSWSTFEDSQELVRQIYTPASIPLIGEPNSHLYLFLRKDIVDRLPVNLRVF